jgi:hypothetical protein
MRNALARMLPLALLLTGCIETPPIPDSRDAYTVSGASSATLPVVLDDNRMFVDVEFVKPDGTTHKALAFVNMGSGAFVLTNALYRELDAGNRATELRLGAMHVAVDSRAVQPEDEANAITLTLMPHKRRSSAEIAKGPGGMMAGFSGPLNVEAVIPPALLARFETVLDYGARTLTLAPPGSLAPDGTEVPMRVDPRTGFAMVDLTVDGKTHPMVIDDGGSYTVVRGDVASDWDRHLRVQGPVGESNYLMIAGVDTDAPVFKVEARLGALTLNELGATAVTSDGMMGRLVSHIFWGMYSDKAGERVDGWLAGNLLKHFRVTLDYAHGTSWWRQISPLDDRDLDQVGVTLARMGNVTVIAGIARKDGAPTVVGVEPGDALVAIDGRATATMTRGALLDALHGVPGARKHLTLKRQDKEIEIDAAVTSF